MLKLVTFPLALIRFILFLLWSAIFISSIAIINSILGVDMDRAIRQRKYFAYLILRILGINMSFRGPIPSEPAMIVSNHRSYLDPFPMLTLFNAVPIAKSELASWPLIGYGAKITGVIFLERGNKSNRTHTRQVIADTVKSGHHVINYVEGTTHKEPQSIDFKTGSFVMAAEQGLRIVPTATDYKAIDDAWVGDDTFVPHFFRCFSKWQTEVKISFSPSIQHSDAQYLIQASKNFIDQELLTFRKEWDRS